MRLWWISVGVCFAGAAVAGAPLTLTHTGRLLGADGTPVVGARDLRVSLYGDVSTTTPFWTRLYDDVPVQSGYFALSLVTSDTAQPLDADDFADGGVWVETFLDGVSTGARQPLGSVPYALVAGSATPGVAPSVVLQSTDGLRCTRLSMTPTGYDVQWEAVDCTTGATVGLTLSGGVWTYAGGALATCKTYRQHPSYASQGDGVYRIDPDGNGVGNPSFDAYCDMTTDGGGWTFFGHVDDNYNTTNFFVGDTGTYSTDRTDGGLTYSIAGKLNQKIAHTQMMVTLDQASPTAAKAANKIVFFEYTAGNAGFNTGPIPCVGLSSFSYRTAMTGAFTPGGVAGTCGTQDWYPRTAGSAAYLVLFHYTSNLGNYWGTGIGGNDSWDHDGWWYVR
jgi:hypothetical protein